ncbi:anaerobic nitric oxide reductase flavorubredoxin [Escherichia coli]|uniref:Anaerobic nitric oxide reductase flavorubredoxin n=1 Tax=Escherichia coli TaxID=562 RepID=A0A377BWU5_ECOLX|nr:anaerobic nitric oxide reductase flavorubredoxin [Escherichia coli]
MSIVVKNNIHWVGQRDWEVRDFHGTNIKRCAAAVTTATSSRRKKRADRHRRP